MWQGGPSSFLHVMETSRAIVNKDFPPLSEGFLCFYLSESVGHFTWFSHDGQNFLHVFTLPVCQFRTSKAPLPYSCSLTSNMSFSQSYSVCSSHTKFPWGKLVRHVFWILWVCWGPMICALKTTVWESKMGETLRGSQHATCLEAWITSGFNCPIWRKDLRKLQWQGVSKEIRFSCIFFCVC